MNGLLIVALVIVVLWGADWKSKFKSLEAVNADLIRRFNALSTELYTQDDKIIELTRTVAELRDGNEAPPYIEEQENK